ncbi:tissue inhibitor of metalloproteinase-like [Mercenaria mercenaria]|uniref:tissue inhibitor of metalloproteinase-like n=1 Tax=Mercenaria mercenaria TaxID=6596 RepID=UPI00234E5E25|nr:tissue inhibitor of metalloproteinase-like [Mercenaria mercenaria]
MKYLAVLLVSSWLGYAYACSCAPEPQEDIFCRADYGFLVKTKDNGTIDGYYKKFGIELIENYKTQLGKRNLKFLYTGKDGGMCGVNLKKDTYYILTGNYATIQDANGKKKKRMTIGLCGFRKEFSPPTCNARKET